MAGAVPFGVYVHVPFCTSRCDYCAFATWTDRHHLTGAYLDAVAEEAGRRLSPDRPATSVFFGGGTPSLLNARDVGRILERVPMAPGSTASAVEVTVECNPETVDVAKLRGYAAAGVTRLSLGVQSMVPHVLAGLGRHHDPSAVRRAVAAADRAGFGGSYSVDLIMGGAGETIADWESTLSDVLAFDPPPAHVSAYSLTVEPGTPLAADRARHPDPDDQADKYALADDALTAAGLQWYEISNWARPGAECRHNLLYWQQGEYAGLGCAAHSHAVDPSTGAARRWWNVRTPERYIRAVGRDSPTEAAGEEIGPDARVVEGLELSLRTRHGVPSSALPGWPGDPDLEGLLHEAAPGRLVLTRRGRLLANEVAIRLQG